MKDRMKFVCRLILAGVVFCGIFPALHAETTEQRNMRMEWWRAARFGLFVHWGVYSVPAGEYEGKTVEKYSEWIMDKARIPRVEYEKFAADFNPQSFDADAWVRMAKYAGMKYIVITTKHHDGFCMFDAPNSDYDIVDATPCKKDILREISDACDRHGLKFCTYYSIMDWHHPSQLPSEVEDGRPVWSPTRMADGQKAEYVCYMKEQLQALVVDYHTHVLWFDGEWPDWWTDDDGESLYQWL
ncbi:MAG: alpha-L-fucosidase, partial [Kiritimatiellales bacterium]